MAQHHVQVEHNNGRWYAYCDGCQRDSTPACEPEMAVEFFKAAYPHCDPPQPTVSQARHIEHDGVWINEIGEIL